MAKKLFVVKLEARDGLALHSLRGLPEEAHDLVMTSTDVLRGTRAAFVELIDQIDEDLVEGMVPKAHATCLNDLAERMAAAVRHPRCLM